MTAVSQAVVRRYDGVPGDRQPRRVDRAWRVVRCVTCGEETVPVDSWQTSGSLFKRDESCVNEKCERFGKTWTYYDFRGLTEEQKRDPELRGILL